MHIWMATAVAILFLSRSLCYLRGKTTLSMISILLSLFLFAPDGYVTAYPSQSRQAIETFESCKAELKKVLPGATDEELRIVFAIVAPEAGCYNSLTDYFETAAVKKGYPSSGSPDYSIGLFQMKPSFAESLENEVAKDSALKSKYGSRFAYGSNDTATKRRERVNRLANTNWQICYLALFVDVVKKRTSTWGLDDAESKVRYWSTLYNAGFYLSKPRVEQRQGVKQFPRGTKEFNYSAVAVELYKALKD